MTEKRKIRFGIPKGNLNRPDDSDHEYRGHTKTFLEMAGFKMRNYEPEFERTEKDADGRYLPIFAEGEPDIEFYCMRPRNQLPGLLDKGKIDIAIMGRDTVEEFYSSEWRRNWARMDQEDWGDEKKRLEHWKKINASISSSFRNELEEEHLSSLSIWDLANLRYGKMNLYWATLPDNPFQNSAEDYAKDCMVIATAFPNIALGQISRHLDSWLINIIEEQPINPCGPDLKAEIYPYSSNTEEMIKLGFQIIFDGISSGSALRRNGLVTKGQPIVKSTAHLYANTAVGNDYYRFKYGKNPIFNNNEEFDKLISAAEDKKEAKKTNIDINRLDEIVQRLSNACLKYSNKHKDSIDYTGEQNE